MRCEVPGLGETPGFNLCLQAFKYRKRISFQEQNCILRTFVRTRVRGSYSIISGVYLLLSWCQLFFFYYYYYSVLAVRHFFHSAVCLYRTTACIIVRVFFCVSFTYFFFFLFMSVQFQQYLKSVCRYGRRRKQNV